tara:strand:- start:246 stop:377 length:132 start_codon:yes stop_codon:yes gene_type:complete
MNKAKWLKLINKRDIENTGSKRLFLQAAFLLKINQQTGRYIDV